MIRRDDLAFFLKYFHDLKYSIRGRIKYDFSPFLHGFSRPVFD